MSISTDETGVASACAEVMRRAQHVHIDDGALNRACDALIGDDGVDVPAWNGEWHYFDGTVRSANYVLVLDALNFSFWPDPGQTRWIVRHRRREWGGYWALTAAIQRAIGDGVPVLDAKWLAEITMPQVERLLAGELHGDHTLGDGYIPLLDARHAHLQEVGRVLVTRYDGQFVHLVEDVRRDAVHLTLRVAEELPSFNDIATYQELKVPIFKRAQILAVDLFGTFGGRECGNLKRLDALTAFADYKVPQVLRRLGILHYDAELTEAVDQERLIPPGDAREVEIRAATVDAVERMRVRMLMRGHLLRAYEIDWLLWGLSQNAHPDDRPYHRTRTIYY